MTAVIGMLNKRGVAIAADSAVTRHRGGEQKITKNGNKMIRVSDAMPISVMITGNAEFIRNPWDVIVRKYRQERGKLLHSTVEDTVMDFLGYLAANDRLWDKDIEGVWLSNNLERFISKLIKNIDSEAKKMDDSGKIKRPRKFVNETIKALKEAKKYYTSDNEGFKDYDFERFKTIINPVLEDNLIKINPFNFSIKSALYDCLGEIREELLMALYKYVTSLNRNGGTTLIFTGYGESEMYPSLIAIDLNGGFDRHINWAVNTKIRIDDATPAAICPFAQTDVINALLAGASGEWLDMIDDNMNNLYTPIYLLDNVLGKSEDMQVENENLMDLDSVDASGLQNRRKKAIRKFIKENHAGWVNDLADYDVKGMAELALTLVDLTGLQRILTFQQEGVGGDVDLAVITKSDGFTWLSRKSWYHHKDIGGRYGSMGV